MKSLPQQTMTDLECVGTPYEMSFVQGRQRRGDKRTLADWIRIVVDEHCDELDKREADSKEK